jgi:ABC-2 type transport system permease protein
MTALLALIKTQVRLYLSNRRALLVNLVAPIAIAGFFGSVFGAGETKPVHVPVALVDLDQSTVSKALASGMQGDPALDVQLIDEAAALEAVRRGKVRVAVMVPQGFGEQATRALFSRGAKPQVRIEFDPSQSMALSLVRGLLAQHSMEAVFNGSFAGADGVRNLDEVLSAIDQASSGIEADERKVLKDLLGSVRALQERRQSDESGRSSGGGAGFEMPYSLQENAATSALDRKYNGFAHAFAGMGVQFVLFAGIELGIGILVARRLGLWARLRAAPLTRSTVLGSYVVSGTLIATCLMGLIFTAAIVGFGVRVDGSKVGFVGVTLAFGLLTATFGLLLAALGKTPEATRGLAILATLLLVMLGGAWVPTFIFPEWLQRATVVVPVRWAVDGFDAMTWRGLGLEAAIAPIGVMLGFSLLFAAVAIWRFRWRE